MGVDMNDLMPRLAVVTVPRYRKPEETMEALVMTVAGNPMCTVVEIPGKDADTVRALLTAMYAEVDAARSMRGAQAPSQARAQGLAAMIPQEDPA